MKRILSLITITLLTLSLVACGKNYKARTFDFFGDDFSWDMSIKDAKEYIEKHQINDSKIEIDEGKLYTIVSDNYYIFRFDTDEKMDFVKLKVGADDNILDMIIDEYGNYDGKGDIAGAPYYYWYGTLSGEPTKLSLDTDSISDYYYIEFCLED